MKALGKLRGHDIDATAVNPGGWFGRTWLIEIGGSYWPIFFVVEADSADDAIDEFSDSVHGHHIHIAPEDMVDYPEPYYDGNGRPCDIDHIMIHGMEGRHVASPWPCRYVGKGLPPEGIAASEYEAYLEEQTQ